MFERWLSSVEDGLFRAFSLGFTAHLVVGRPRRRESRLKNNLQNSG